MQRATEDSCGRGDVRFERWSSLQTPAGPRRLAAPEVELAQALAERQSITAKVALKSLEEAPTAGGGRGETR